jgi:alginate biosynthesis protein Alg44
MNRQQRSVIQYFVTAYLSGEIIRVNDIMDVVARNNFTRARNVPDALAGLSAAEIRRRKNSHRMKVAALSLVALSLVGYISMSIYERMFVVSATSGRVTAEMLTVDAPAGGKVFFNPLEPDSKVTQGQPLLTVSTNTGNVMAVDSPCDCIVKRRLSDNNRLIRKGEPALELVRPDTKPIVEAYIPHRAAVKLTVGDEAMLSIPGQGRYLRGTVTAIQAGKGLSGNALVLVKPSTPLPVTAVDDPVELRVDTLHLL